MLDQARQSFRSASATLPIQVIRRFIEDDGPTWATVIAWNALTAVFPVALALIAIGGFILSLAGLGPGALLSEVAVLFPSDAKTQADALQGIQGVKERSLVFALLALGGYLFTASNLFGALEAAFDAVYHCGRRDFVPQKLMGLAMMGIFSVLAALGVATSALPPLLQRIPDLPGWLTRGVTSPLQLGIGVASGFVLYFAIYLVVPARHPRMGEVWPGALFAGVGFKLLTLLFPLYIRLNPGINQFGRDFALLFVLLTFFFFFGLITMIGAELNAVLYTPGPRREAGGAALPVPGVVPVPGAPLRGVRRALMTAVGAAIGLLLASRQQRHHR